MYTVDDLAGKTHFVKGVLVEYTEAEKQAIADEWNANAAARPFEEWKAAMAASDAVLPRWAEDVIDAMIANGSGRAIAQETVDKRNAKKALRATRP